MKHFDAHAHNARRRKNLKIEWQTNSHDSQFAGLQMKIYNVLDRNGKGNRNNNNNEKKKRKKQKRILKDYYPTPCASRYPSHE